MRIQVVLTALVISHKGGERSGNAKEGNSPIGGILMPGLLIKKPRPWSETWPSWWPPVQAVTCDHEAFHWRLWIMNRAKATGMPKFPCPVCMPCQPCSIKVGNFWNKATLIVCAPAGSLCLEKMCSSECVLIDGYVGTMYVDNNVCKTKWINSTTGVPTSKPWAYRVKLDISRGPHKICPAPSTNLDHRGTFSRINK